MVALTLPLGQTRDKCLWIRKSQTSNNGHVLGKLHQLGMTSKMYGNNLFLMMTLRFLQKGEVVTQEHIDIYDALDPKHFKEGEMPTTAEEEASPFPRWVPPNLSRHLAGSNGVGSSNCGKGGKGGKCGNGGNGGNGGNDGPTEPTPAPEPDSGSDTDDGEIFDLFA